MRRAGGRRVDCDRDCTGCERNIRYAFEYALRHSRKKVTIVHKANILKMVSGLFLEVGKRIQKEYEGRSSPTT